MEKFLISTVLVVIICGFNVRAATYQYDNLNRLIRVEYTPTKAINYRYDPSGNLLTIKSEGMNCAQVITHAYNPITGEEKDYPTPCDIPNGWTTGQAPDNDNDGMNDILDPDDDNDGLPDVFETQNGLNPLDASDAAEDADYDGFSNKQEYEANTNPNDPNSKPVNNPKFQKLFVTHCDRISADQEFGCDIEYTTTDFNSGLTGIGFRLHYDDRKLEWIGFENVLLNAGAFNNDVIPRDDERDKDHDPSTTKTLSVAWAGLEGQWPGSDLPVRLFTGKFKAKANLLIGDKTTLGFSPTGLSSGYGFQSEAKTLEVVDPCSLDIDGNGKAEPLSDGLLLLRYLFQFNGDALVDQAIGENATRTTTSAIETYLDQCQTAFDIDNSGETRPLTDGLLALRYLFTFRNDALVNDAVDVTAQRGDAASITRYLDQLN